MIFCLDCGNSRLKWGLREGEEWRASGALAHAEIALLPAQIPAGAVLHRVIGCNVAGAECAAQIEAALHLRVDWITSQAAQCGVSNGYESSASLGADRWAALIGAHALHKGPALVVLAGTATTIDVLGADGRHRGGLILPGLTLMAASLSSATARLPFARGGYQAIPRNTHDAITSGAIQATLGAIERMFRTLLPEPDAICLLSGGAADSLLPHLDLSQRFIEHLVLEGVVRIAAIGAVHPA